MGYFFNPEIWVARERLRFIGRSIKWLVTWLMFMIKRADEGPVLGVETG